MVSTSHRFSFLPRSPGARKWVLGLVLSTLSGLVFSSLLGQTSPQPTPPAKPVPTAPAKAPAPPPPPAGESTPGVVQVQDLLSSLARFDQEGRLPEHKMGFEIPESAINEYLAYALRNRPRPGVSAANVKLLPRNEASLLISIDFDALRQWNSEMIPELFRPVLTGKLALQLNAQFEAKNGFVTFTLKDAKTLEGKVIPGKLLTEVFHVIGSRQPESFDVGRPVTLPFGLKRVWTEKQLVCGET